MAEKNSKLLYGEIVNRCWEDAAFAKSFKAEPKKILAESGIPVEDKSYKVIEAPRGVQYVVLPHTDAKEALELFARSLLSVDTATVLPEGTEIRIIQNTATTNYLILPAAPEELSVEELDAVAGGDKAKVSTNYYAHAEVVSEVVEAVVANTTGATQTEAAVAAFVVVGAILI